MNSHRKEKILLSIENIFLYLQKDISPLISTIGFISFLYLLPIFCLLVAPIFNILLLTIFTLNPNYIINDNISYIAGGILLGALLFPYFSMCKLKLNKIGIPNYTFNFWKFIIGLFVSPLIIGTLVDFFIPQLTISELFSFIVDKSNFITNYIQQVMNLDNSFYFKMLIKIIPMAILTIISLKYLLYWFIMSFLNLLFIYPKLLIIN
ncbi:hypothetical protein Q6A88_07795 [Aliarcobacter skirrowii]|uniref:hypothetical protein n=1 Tax=Aliarcobacter skirrowii TaxID=28200 RepID=UPI0029B85F04|nr:hypothetical protein [Aliarcobacter skirrowii]MDX4071603.1 hypothetical protein [Aliarcobacter skirrowii]